MKLRAQFTMLIGVLGALATAAFAAPAPAASTTPSSAATPVHKLGDIRIWPRKGVTRIVIDAGGENAFLTGELHGPERVYFDFENTTPTGPRQRTITSKGLVQQVRVALTKRTTTRVVIDMAEPAAFETTWMVNPSRLVIELRKAGEPKPEVKLESVEPKVSETRESAPKMSKARKVALKEFVPPPPVVLPKTPLIAPAKIDVSKPSREVWLARLEVPQTWSPSQVAPPVKIKKPAVVVAEKKLPSKATEAKTGKGHKKPQDVAKLEVPRASEALGSDVETADVSIGAPASGSDTLTRALGLKLRRVVLDAGHGGKDVGTISPHGMYEKDLVLDVTRRLGKLVEERLGSEVVYTRADDTFIPLQERTAIANREKADLFLSIHANSSRTDTVAGFETYYLNLSATKADMDVAARENASSDKTIADLNDLVKQITLNEKLDESRQFAGHVHDATYPLVVKTHGKIHDRGVKKAPFMVLIGARMPSVLVEIGFMTNPTEETQMKKAEYRQKIAEALFQGISGYAETLSHFVVAHTDVASLEAGN